MLGYGEQRDFFMLGGILVWIFFGYSIGLRSAMDWA